MGAGYLLQLLWLVQASALAQEYRLSRDVIPDLYDIHIKPYLQMEDGEKQFTFDGQVNLTLHPVVNNVRNITLHKNLIEVLNTELYDTTNGNLMENISSESLIYETLTHKLTIKLATPLVLGKHYTLYFKYLGEIRNGMAGFYRVTNDNVNWYGMTQLHRIDARTVFPCFDEPEFKAKFRMHISRTTKYKSFFNTRLTQTTNTAENRFIDHFDETPLMSTYLVAFLINDFESHGSDHLKIITRTKSNNKIKFAFEVGLKALNAFDNYTQLPYKSLGNGIMQMVATNQFPHSGMENWGLVFYKESALVYEPGYTDGWSHKQYTVSLVVHETAHMWFGNSVTHKWWSYFWLNEALPNYYQYFMAHEMYPEYELEKQFLVEEMHSIFDIDATNSTQPLTSMEKSIRAPLQIASKFSSIAYSKGASVIHMFKNLMGNDNFDMAIRKYLKENHLESTTPHDLFKQLKQFWPVNQMVDLNEFFKDWTEQVGYPMVTVSITPGGRFSVKQQRFLLDSTDGSDATLKYTVPITLVYDKTNDFENVSPKFYLNKKQDERLFGNTSQHKWIIVNSQQSNYYRVFYDTELLQSLRIALNYKNHSGIHVNNRAALVDDLFTYARIGLRGYDEVLHFLEYLTIEEEYAPWQAAFKGFNTIYKRMTLAQHNKFREFLYEILGKIFQTLGFGHAQNGVLVTYLRNNVISWLCKYHYEECNAQAKISYEKYLSANVEVNPDFRETLYCAVLRNDDSYGTYEHFKEKIFKQNLPSEQQKIIRAMGCTRYFVRDHYEFLLTSNITDDLKIIGLKSLYSQTPENIITVFNLILTNVEQLTRALKDWSATDSIIADVANYLTSEEHLILLKKFTMERGKLFNSSINVLECSIDQVERNLKWSAHHLGKLTKYLNERNVEYRLSTDVVPNSYDIHMKMYLKPEDGENQFTVDASVNITLQANRKNVNKITLHKKQIDILQAILYDASGMIVENVTNGSMLEEPKTDKLNVFLLKPLQANTTYVLFFRYQSKINSRLSGLFKATYDDVNWYGITQLQRINARTVFPCFDEPAFKAKFRMHISRPKEYNSVFNTRLEKSTIDGATNYIDDFEETPLMSTYLLAFLVSDFETHGNEVLRFIMHSKFQNKTNFAFNAALEILAAFDNYTQAPYKSLGNSIMQKAGSICFPHNGMENWGLVLYKDTVLVHEPDYTDGWSNKEYTLTILTHETSHMWFGNSVTFKWWSHFWLNEAFARYYQYFLAHEIHPEFELDKQFVIKQLQVIFDLDATGNTQPLTSQEQSINTPDEIAYKFSSIAYAKGAAIVRMFANLMGKENFDQAIREYLRENHLRNVVPDNLFQCLRRRWPSASQVDLNVFFKDWTEQSGYPLLMVSLNSKGRFCLRQKRFLLEDKDGHDASIRYTIPITFNNKTKNNYNELTPSFYFNKTLSVVEFPWNAAHDREWIVVNTQQSNYFRVFYNSHLLSNLRLAFAEHNHSGIHVTNRANVIDDLFAVARAGLTDYQEVFEFMEYLATETAYTPWYAAFKGFNVVYVRSTLEQHPNLCHFFYEVLDKVYHKLGFQNPHDTVLDVYNRNSVISWLCKCHHEDCSIQAKRIFLSHMAAGTKPTPDFRETLYCAACRYGGSNIYESLKQMFKNETLQSEKEKILRAMGCTSQYVEHHYEFILSHNVPRELKPIALSSLYNRTPENVMPVLKLMTGNVELLAEALQSWSATAAAFNDISNYLTTLEQLKLLQRFTHQKQQVFKDCVTILEKSIESTKENLKWSMSRLDKLFEYLAQRNSAASICRGL